MCTYNAGLRGDPISACTLFPPPKPVEIDIDPCDPNPCGPNNQHREINGICVCSCLPSYLGTPPAGRPECVVSSDQSQVKACVNQKCVDPCPGVCGNNAKCQVTNHNPVCQCPPGYQGDPFSQCSYIKRQVYLTYLQKNLQDHKTNNENHEIPLNPTSLHSRYKLGFQVLILIHHCQSSENHLSQIITT